MEKSEKQTITQKGPQQCCAYGAVEAHQQTTNPPRKEHAERMLADIPNELGHAL